jgi:hypothetical protein
MVAHALFADAGRPPSRCDRAASRAEGPVGLEVVDVVARHRRREVGA